MAWYWNSFYFRVNKSQCTTLRVSNGNFRFNGSSLEINNELCFLPQVFLPLSSSWLIAAQSELAKPRSKSSTPTSWTCARREPRGWAKPAKLTSSSEKLLSWQTGSRPRSSMLRSRLIFAFLSLCLETIDLTQLGIYWLSCNFNFPL